MENRTVERGPVLVGDRHGEPHERAEVASRTGGRLRAECLTELALRDSEQVDKDIEVHGYYLTQVASLRNLAQSSTEKA